MGAKQQIDLLSFTRQRDKAAMAFKGIKGDKELEFIVRRPSNPFGDMVETNIAIENFCRLINDFLLYGRSSVTEGEAPYSVTLTMRLTTQGLTLETKENDSSTVPATYVLAGYSNIKQRVVIKMLLHQALQNIAMLY